MPAWAITMILVVVFAPVVSMIFVIGVLALEPHGQYLLVLYPAWAVVSYRVIRRSGAATWKVGLGTVLSVGSAIGFFALLLVLLAGFAQAFG